MNLRKYLYYALGEILLVVVGILIALHLPAREATAEQAGINNWNEIKKDRQFEQKMLTEVKNALYSDQEHYLQQHKELKDLRETAKFFVDYIADSKDMHDSLFNKFFSLNNGVGILFNDGPYSAFKAVGLDKIYNDSLRNELIKFYEFLYPGFIASLEHYDRNSVRDIDRLVSLLTDPYILKRGDQNILAQDFRDDILMAPVFHRNLRSILFRTNSLIRTINQFQPVIKEMIQRIESEIAS